MSNQAYCWASSDVANRWTQPASVLATPAQFDAVAVAAA
jgi:hypothetical protein